MRGAGEKEEVSWERRNSWAARRTSEQRFGRYTTRKPGMSLDTTTLSDYWCLEHWTNVVPGQPDWSSWPLSSHPTALLLRDFVGSSCIFEDRGFPPSITVSLLHFFHSLTYLSLLFLFDTNSTRLPTGTFSVSFSCSLKLPDSTLPHDRNVYHDRRMDDEMSSFLFSEGVDVCICAQSIWWLYWPDVTNLPRTYDFTNEHGGIEGSWCCP